MIQYFKKWRQRQQERYHDWLLKTCICGSYSGVALTNLTVTTDNDSLAQTLTDALKLIERHDPRRFRRVQREVRYIAADYLLAAGTWRHRTRTCALNPQYCKIAPDSPDREWELAYIAAVIVHEATHGALHSRGCPYDEKNRARVERICRTEEKRFISRLESERYDLSALIPPFDETRWHEHWQRTHRQEATGRFALFWKDFRSSARHD